MCVKESVCSASEQWCRFIANMLPGKTPQCAQPCKQPRRKCSNHTPVYAAKTQNTLSRLALAQSWMTQEAARSRKMMVAWPRGLSTSRISRCVCMASCVCSLLFA